jgi:hypothetical protein
MTRITLALVATLLVVSPVFGDNTVQVQGDGNFVVVNGGNTAYVGPIVIEDVPPPVYVTPVPIYVVETVVVPVRVCAPVCVQPCRPCCQPSCYERFRTPVTWGPCGQFFCDDKGQRWNQEGCYQPLPNKPDLLVGTLVTVPGKARVFVGEFYCGRKVRFVEVP